jgi:hypothetical protein
MLPAPVQVAAPTLLGSFSTHEQVLKAVEHRVTCVVDRGPGERVRVVRGQARTAEPAMIARWADPSGVLVVRFDTILVKDVAPDLFLRRLYGSDRDVSSMLAELGPLRIPNKLLEEARDRDGEGDEWEIVEDERHPEWHWRSLREAVTSVAGALSLQGEELPLLVRSRSVPEGLPLVLHAFSLSQQYFVAKLYRAITATVIRLTDVCSEHGASAFKSLQQMWSASGLPVPNTADQMIVTASRVLNLTAAGCGPRIDLATPDGSPAPTNTTAPDLLSSLAAQMVAHVSVGAPARRCAHPPCRRWFTHQQGRAVHDRHRSRGVRYCSSNCARAAAQRAYRDRQRGSALSDG